MGILLVALHFPLKGGWFAVVKFLLQFTVVVLLALPVPVLRNALGARSVLKTLYTSKFLGFALELMPCVNFYQISIIAWKK